MVNLYFKDGVPEVNITWRVFKGQTDVPEDFSRSLVHLWLVSEYDQTQLSCTAENGRITASFVQGEDFTLEPAVYSLKAIWIKDPDRERILAHHDRARVFDHGPADKICYAEVLGAFMITSYEEDSNVTGDSVKLNFVSRVATYGYDGLSAYEAAVLYKVTTAMSEKEYVQMRASYVDTNQIKDGAITTAKIADEAVTTDKIAALAVTAGKIAALAVTAEKLMDGSIASYHIMDGAISAIKIADGAVTTQKIADGAVTQDKIAAGAITTEKFADGTITTFIGEESDRLSALEEQYEELCQIVKKYHPDEPIGGYYYVYGVPAISAFVYNSAETTPSAGGSLVVSQLAYSQTCVKRYYDGRAEEAQPSITSGAAAVYTITEGTGATVNSATGQVVWSPNTDTEARSITVKVQVTLNGQVGESTITLSQEAHVKTVASIEYAIPEITLYYATAKAAGEALKPTFSYRQLVTVTFNDGSKETSYVSENAEVAWTNTDSTSSGVVTVEATTETSTHTVKQVGVSVTLNGRTGSKNATVLQAGAVIPVTYYYGEVDASKAEFSQMNLDALAPISATCDKGSATGDVVVNATHTVFYVMIPASGTTLTKFKYTSDGDDSDILGEDAFNTVHENVTINDIEYKVYAYRQATTSEADPLKWTYAIQF